MTDKQHSRDSGTQSASGDELRRNAEKLIDGLAALSGDPVSTEDTAALLHELRVHQIELEMQNEELRTAQLELDKQRASYYELFDLAPVGYLTLGSNGIVTAVNLTVVRLLGVERQLLEGQPFSAFVHAEDRNSFYGHLRALEKTGDLHTSEVRLRRVAQGDSSEGEVSHFWARLEGKTHRADDGETLLWMTVVDIDEQRRAGEALRESEQKFKFLWTNSVVAKSLTYPSGEVEVNDAFCEILGYKRTEFADKATWMQLTHPDDVAESQRQIDALLSGEEVSVRFEKRYLRKDGGVVWADLSSSVRRNDAGEPLYLMTTILDVTDRKQLEEALLESEATVQRKLSVILQPEEDIGELNLSDLIDQESLRTMMEELYKLTKLPSAVGDLEGNALVAIGWQDICVKYHRANPGTLANCHESDVVLAGDVPAGEFKEYRCKNHLWDVVTPIYVGERHFGNIYLGQFIYDDEVPDYELFRGQARQYGFDETDYIAALDRVPRVSREAVVAAIGVCSQLAQMISSLGYSKVQLSRSLAQKSAALRKYRTITESISDVVWVLDPLTLRFLYVSPSVEKLRGYTPEEVLAEPMDAALTPDGARAVRGLMGQRTADRLSGKEPPNRAYVEQLEQPCKNGSTVWTEVSTSYRLNEDTGAPEVHGVTRDITTRKQAEEALRENAASHLAILRSAMDGFWLVDTEGRLIEVNDAYCEMSGYSEQELLTMSIADLVDPGTIEDIAPRIQRAVAEGELRFEAQPRRKDGSFFDAEVSVRFQAAGGGRIASFIRDVTERKRAEVALRESLTSIIDVIGNVSEMRDPYTAGHQRRVAELAVAIERELGMSEAEIAEIRTAGLMHDIGKMSIPAEILSKPTALSPIEFSLIKGHPQAGHDIISSAHMPGPIAELVYQHHERCDGSGYPRGLLGDELLEGAKVLAVADVAEAMMSHRPYRAGLGEDAALAEIEQGAGGRYDSQVAEACARVFRERGFEFSEG